MHLPRYIIKSCPYPWGHFQHRSTASEPTCSSALSWLFDAGKIMDNSSSAALPEEMEAKSSQRSRHSGGWRGGDAEIIMDI